MIVDKAREIASKRDWKTFSLSAQKSHDGRFPRTRVASEGEAEEIFITDSSAKFCARTLAHGCGEGQTCYPSLGIPPFCPTIPCCQTDFGTAWNVRMGSRLEKWFLLGHSETESQDKGQSAQKPETTEAREAKGRAPGLRFRKMVAIGAVVLFAIWCLGGAAEHRGVDEDPENDSRGWKDRITKGSYGPFVESSRGRSEDRNAKGTEDPECQEEVDGEDRTTKGCHGEQEGEVPNIQGRDQGATRQGIRKVRERLRKHSRGDQEVRGGARRTREGRVLGQQGTARTGHGSERHLRDRRGARQGQATCTIGDIGKGKERNGGQVRSSAGPDVFHADAVPKPDTGFQCSAWHWSPSTANLTSAIRRTRHSSFSSNAGSGWGRTFPESLTTTHKRWALHGKEATMRNREPQPYGVKLYPMIWLGCSMRPENFGQYWTLQSKGFDNEFMPEARSYPGLWPARNVRGCTRSSYYSGGLRLAVERPDIPFRCNEDAWIWASQDPVVAKHATGNALSPLRQDDSIQEDALENRYLAASGSLDSIPGNGASVTISIADDKLCQHEIQDERSAEGCTSSDKFIIQTRSSSTNLICQFFKRGGKSVEGCTSSVCATEWQQGNNFLGRNGRSVERCTSSRSLGFWLEKNARDCTRFRYAYGGPIESLMAPFRQENRHEAASGSLDGTVTQAPKTRLHRNSIEERTQGCTWRNCSRERVVEGKWYYSRWTSPQGHRVLQSLWLIQIIGSAYLTLLQCFFYLLIRLCFLRFDQGYSSTGSELGWQVLRGIFWSGATFLCIVRLQQRRKKRLQRTGKARHCVTVRQRGEPIKLRGLAFAILILNTHACNLRIDDGSLIDGFKPFCSFNKEPLQPRVEESWIRPIHGTSQEQTNGSLIFMDRTTGRWLRAESAMASYWEVEDHRVAIHGHVFNDHRGTRRSQSPSLSHEVILAISRRLWADFCGNFDCPVSRIINQPPSDGLHEEIHYIIELTPRRTDYDYFLVDVFDGGNGMRRTTAAAHSITTVTDLLDTVFDPRSCQPNGLSRCVVRFESREFQRHDEPSIPHASYISAHKLSLEDSFQLLHNVHGLHMIALQVFSISGQGFTADTFTLLHTLTNEGNSTPMVSEFRGQDLLCSRSFARTLERLALQDHTGIADGSSIDDGRTFRIAWRQDDGRVWDPSAHEEEDEAVNLQQYSSGYQLGKARIPGISFRFDPSRFNQERDTAIDDIMYPIPEDANDELLLPPRHRWRNFAEAWPAIQVADAGPNGRARLDTYGLRNHFLSNRLIEIEDTTPASVLQIITTHWADYAIGEHLNIFYVSPQPPTTPPQTVVLIVEFPTDEWDYLSARAALIDTFEDGSPVDRRAEYLEADCPATEVTEVTDTKTRCWPFGIDDCSVFCRNQLHSMYDDLVVGQGDYVTLNIVSFSRRYQSVLKNFPSAREHVSDFLWRSRHYDRPLFTLFVYGVNGQIRVPPLHIERDLESFRAVDTLWSEVFEVFEASQQHGAHAGSTLHQAWPQTIFHAEQLAIHLVLDINPCFPLLPVLVTIVVQAGGLRAQRIETRAWQLPRQITALNMMNLVGYGAFAREFAIDAYIIHGRQQFRDNDGEIQLIQGGNYEVRLTIPSVSDFVYAVAGFAHQHARVTAPSGGPENQAPDEDSDDADLLQISRGPREPSRSLMQSVVTVFLWLAVHPCQASFTDEFLDLAWPITSQGEEELAAAADMDPDLLRYQWQQIFLRYSIPRPLNVATLVIHRPPCVRVPGDTFQITMARLDDPTFLPRDIEANWPDLRMSTWRLFQGHQSIRSALSIDQGGWAHFLLQGRELATDNFPFGTIEVVSVHQSDDHSVGFLAVLPSTTSWVHLWNWLHFGMGFPGSFSYRILASGEQVTQPHAPFNLRHGFFVQVFAFAPEEASLMSIPPMRHRSWSRVLCYALPSHNGNVYKASTSIDGSELARLPYHDRSAAILARWPHLTVWGAFKVHSSGRGRNPPWHTFDDALLVQEHPDGMHVAVLCVVFEGGGPNDYALVLHRHCTIITVFYALECAARCLSTSYVCTATVNQIPRTISEPLNLEEGDYIEVLIFAVSTMKLRDMAVPTPDEAEPQYQPQADPYCDRQPTLTAGYVSNDFTVGLSLLQHNAKVQLRMRTEVRRPPMSTTPRTSAIFNSTQGLLPVRLAGGQSQTRHSTILRMRDYNQTNKYSGSDYYWRIDLLTNEPECRYDFVHRLGSVFEALLGGSCSGVLGEWQHMRSPEISRLVFRLSGESPIWDVDAIFYKLRPPGNGHTEFSICDDEEEVNGPPVPVVTDVRGRIDLQLLDDFHVSENFVLITEVGAHRKDHLILGPTGITEELLHSLMDPWDIDVVSGQFGDVPDLHPLAAQYIASSITMDWNLVEELHLYCDGSTHACPETHNVFASCSLVITASMEKESHYGYGIIGFTGGHVCTDPDSPHWWGATTANSIEAERTGVLLALLWTLQSPYAVGIPCTIWFDCTAAGYGADGKWNYPQDSVLAEVLRGVHQLCDEYCPGSIRLEHTYAHVGDPANELADSIAKAFAKGCLPNYLSRIDLDWLIKATKEHGSWAWLYIGAFAGSSDLPPLRDQIITLPEERGDTVPQCRSSMVMSMHSVESSSVRLNIASVNVKSLFVGDNGREEKIYTPAKACFLAQQLDWCGYDIIGIQETCSKQSGIGYVGNYIRVMSGCTPQGQLGCDLWLHQNKLQVKPGDLCVLAHDPRRLVVRVQTAALDMVITILHSPHSGDSVESRKTWWNTTRSLCQRFSTLAPQIICIDANAQITSAHPPHTGTLTDGKPNPNEEFLIELCRLCDLFAPCTFEEVQQNASGTWWHPSDRWLRIDYVLLPLNWRLSVTSTWTDSDIDLCALSPDHRLTGCNVHMVVPKHQKEAPFGNYNWEKLDDPGVHARLSHAISSLPRIPWDKNVHDHAATIRDNLHMALSDTLGPAKRRRKSSYITDATWATREGKRKLSKLLQAREAYLNNLWTVWSFEAWRDAVHLFSMVRPHFAWLLRCEIGTAHLRRSLRDTTKELKKNLETDRSDYARNCADRCRGQPLHIVFQELRKLRIGGAIRKRGRPPLPSLCRKDGQAAEDCQEIAEIWRLHCAQLEAGEIVTPEGLHSNLAENCSHRALSSISPDDLPTLSCLEKHVRKVQAHKAPGCDRLPSLICKTFPREISRMLYPLLLKQAVTLEEAAEYKGGMLVAMYKGKGSVTQASSYRGLMLTSIVGKTIRSAYREKMLRTFYTYTSDGHYSARARGNVGQAALTLRLYMRYAKQHQLNCGVVFLDIQHAYYSVCRELASGFVGTDEQLCHIFKFFNLSPETVNDLKKLIAEGSAMDYAGSSGYHQSLLHELGSGTWYRVRNSHRITQTHGGSRPGDGLADLIFGFIFARMLDTMRDEMQQAGIWDDREWRLPVNRSAIILHGFIPECIPTNLEICWADDLALAMVATTATGLIHRIQAVGSFLFRWIGKFGMKPNLQRGKSETLLHLRGPRSRQMKLALFSPEDPAIDIVIENEEFIRLRITHQYRHLGGQLHYVGNMVQEVKARCGMAKAAFNDYRRKVFANNQLSLSHRGQLLHCLILSILRWNYGAWPSLDKWAYHRYHSTVILLAKKICYADSKKEEVWSRRTDQVLSDLAMCSPQEALHVARLGFYTTAYHTAPDCLWLLVAAERSWINQVDEALQWALSQLHNSIQCENFVDFMGYWCTQVEQRRHNWRGLVKRAEQHAILQRRNRTLVQAWHADLYDKLVMANFQIPGPQNVQVSSPGDTIFFCGLCYQVFDKRTAWAVHSFKIHGRQEPLRHYLADGVCRGCGGNYHTTRRLLSHLKYRYHCAVQHVCCSQRVDIPLPGRNSAKEDQDQPLQLPAVTGRKPESPTPDMERRFRELTKSDTFTTPLCQLIHDSTEEEQDHPERMAERIRGLVLQQVMASDDIHEILVAMWNQLGERRLDKHARGLRYILDNWTINWLMPETSDKSVTLPKGWFDTTNLDELKADVVRNLTNDSVAGPTRGSFIPRLRFREVLAVHFFSGTRREGDFQYWIDRIRTFEGLVVTAVSVDILYDSVKGDLTNHDTQQKWLGLAYAGIIVSAVMGPPCNTWSVSRWRALWALDNGPRPLRFLDQYFGAPSLRLTELKQVILGNSLLFFALSMVFALGLTGRVAVLEHPDVPDYGPPIPTIWSTGAFAALKKLPGAEVLQLHQGLYGAKSPKPTRLCVTGGLNSREIFRRFETFPMPKALRMQKIDKQFSTAALKEYPSAFSCAIAECVSAWLEREHLHFSPGSALEVSRQTSELVEPFRVDFCDLHTIGADTRGAFQLN